MNSCFVIQPFDKSKFDLRYNDIFEPAIKKANLTPYRVDKDPSVRVPIEEIENKIREARICFAEITTDNPNVWYELGYASSCGKDVVMVCCTEERVGKFPFDIQHRHILTYSTSSTSSFKSLEQSITDKINALISSSKTLEKISESPIIDFNGLDGNEIAMLIIIMENSFATDDSISVYLLKENMLKAGFTEIATSYCTRTLKRKGLVEIFKDFEDYSNSPFYACRLTEAGENWMLANKDKIKFRKDPQDSQKQMADDLPF